MDKQQTNIIFDEFRSRLMELSHLKSAISVLYWDNNVYMPEQGTLPRAATISYIAGELHKKFLAPEFKSLITNLKAQLDNGGLNDSESAITREVWREFEREEKLPLEFVKELTQISAEALHTWTEARKKSDFKIFLPHLKKIIELKRKEAYLVGYENSPYDALLDTFEPYSTTDEISIILEELKGFLIPFIERIKNSKVKINPNILKGVFEIEKQKVIAESIAQKIGFNFLAGRLDTSTHPFTTASHPHDVRITTRFDINNLFYSFFSTIHETGHALYEQGLPTENFGSPLAESASTGIHESQSRIWENMVGKSRSFWNYFYPVLQKEFPDVFSKMAFNDFYRAINAVEPSLIRTEADEVTYNLHIIMRFEIEKALIEGTIEAEYLPKIWNEKTKELFGIDVPSDAMGVLQDVHWSDGLFGYFPTYALGNLYSAQFYETAKRELLNLEDEISVGQFSHFRKWLNDKIHIHGRFYSASKLVFNVTGEKLASKYFIKYLTDKYTKIYEL